MTNTIESRTRVAMTHDEAADLYWLFVQGDYAEARKRYPGPTMYVSPPHMDWEADGEGGTEPYVEWAMRNRIVLYEEVVRWENDG